jgi:AraC-like DNA-binding protein
MVSSAAPIDIFGQKMTTQICVDAVRRPIVSAQLLARIGLERGLTMEECLRGTGIDLAALANPATEIIVGQELRLIRNLLEDLGPAAGLGLDVGLRYHLSSYGIWGFALISRPTLRSAARLAVSYLDLSYSFCKLRLEDSGQDLLVVFDDHDLPADLHQFLMERDFAAWAKAAWEMRPGGFPASALQFRFPRPSYAWRFEKIAGARPKFNAPLNAVLLNAASLDAPLPQANLHMARLCEEQCRHLLARRRIHGGLEGEIRDRLRRDPSAMPSIETVAHELHIASRSLRRRLAGEGTSYRALLNEVRQALAEELLLSAHLKLSDIAERLGYAEPAPFITAFKRWKGVSPDRYRRQMGYRDHDIESLGTAR